jgi:hypothetical protein
MNKLFLLLVTFLFSCTISSQTPETFEKNNENTSINEDSISSKNDNLNTGQIYFWANHSCGSNIKIYINEIFIGELSTYVFVGAPECNYPNVIKYQNKEGKYNYRVESKDCNWTGTFTITKGVCKPKLLNQKIK